MRARLSQLPPFFCYTPYVVVVSVVVSDCCVFFTLNRSFYPPTSSTTSVRTDSSILLTLLEPQSRFGQNYLEFGLFVPKTGLQY